MKKVVTILLIALLALPLFAEGATEVSSSSEPTKIIIFQSKVEITESLERAVEDFKAETGIEVEIWETTGDDYRSQLQLRLAGDEVPTIFSVSKGSEAELFAPYLADISAGKVQEYVSDPLALVSNGARAGVPYAVEGYGFVANKNLVKAEDIATFDGLISFIEKNAASGINPLGLSAESFFLIGHILNAPFAVMDDPEGFIAEYEKGNVRLRDQKSFQQFAVLMETIRKSCLNPLEINYDKSCGDFATGKTAMIHQGNWAYGMFSSYDVNFDMGILPVPILDNKNISISVPYYWAVNSQATPAQQEAAIKFLDWLYTSEKGIDYVLNEFLFVPATSNIPVDTLDPLSADVSKAAGEGRAMVWATTYWPMNIVDTDFRPITEEFFTNPEMTGLDFIDRIDAAYQSRL